MNSVHLEEIAKNLIVEHLFYTMSIAINNRTPEMFFHYFDYNNQRHLNIRETRVEWKTTTTTILLQQFSINVECNQQNVIKISL